MRVHVVTATPRRPDVAPLLLPAPICAVAESWAPSVARYDRAQAGPELHEWLVARGEFLCAAKVLLTEEDVIVPPREGCGRCGNVSLVTRKSSVSAEQFRRAWHGVHGAMAHDVPHLGGFTLCDVVGERAPVGLAELGGPPVDGIARAAFASRRDEELMAASEEARAWFDDGAATFGQIAGFESELLAESRALSPSEPAVPRV